MSITALPTPPQRSDPTNFPARADAFMSALPTFGTEANALQADVNAKQLAASNSAANAATSESNAASSASAAAASASAAAISSGVTAWVSGTTYTVGDVRYSPIDFRSYRRTTVGAGTTDPSIDTTNWLLVSNGPEPCMIVQEQQPSGTAAASAGGSGVWTTRTLNTVVSNTINGASLASNTITLPQGMYEVRASTWASNTNSVGLPAGRHVLYNNTDSANAILGDNLSVVGRITISATKDFSLRTFISGNPASGGNPAASGLNEVYTQVIIKKLN